MVDVAVGVDGGVDRSRADLSDHRCEGRRQRRHTRVDQDDSLVGFEGGDPAKGTLKPRSLGDEIWPTRPKEQGVGGVRLC